MFGSLAFKKCLLSTASFLIRFVFMLVSLVPKLDSLQCVKQDTLVVSCWDVFTHILPCWEGHGWEGHDSIPASSLRVQLVGLITVQFCHAKHTYFLANASFHPHLLSVPLLFISILFNPKYRMWVR